MIAMATSSCQVVRRSWRDQEGDDAFWLGAGEITTKKETASSASSSEMVDQPSLQARSVVRCHRAPFVLVSWSNKFHRCDVSQFFFQQVILVGIQ